MNQVNNKIYAALVKARAEFEPVVFDKVNPHFKNQFASLKAIENATQKALAKYGMTIIQPWCHLENGDVIIYTKIIHESGEEIVSSCLLVKGNKTDQQFGSSVTYMRRYQLSSVLGITGEEDDDGEAEQGRISPPIDIKKKQEVKKVENDEFINEKQVKMWVEITKDFPEYKKLIIKKYGVFEKILASDAKNLFDHFNQWKNTNNKEAL